jgi:two-component system cell cycle response regulator
MQNNPVHTRGSGMVPVPQSSRRDTPILPSAPIGGGAHRATLTVLTGLHAGRLLAMGPNDLVIGRAPDADLIVEEDSVSRHHARISRGQDGTFTIVDLDSANGTFVGVKRVSQARLMTGDQVQLGRELRLRFRLIDATEESLYRQLYESSVHDGLTRAYNRRHFSERLLVEVSRALRTDSEVAVLMIDVDRLKELNDTCGHLAGDRALASIAASISHSVRLEDLFARYGGDEFAILAPGTNHDDAIRLAERVRRGVDGLRFGAGGKSVRVTVSVGVASLRELGPSDETHIALVSLADERLYRAKRRGRNSVFSGDIAPPEALPEATSA